MATAHKNRERVVIVSVARSLIETAITFRLRRQPQRGQIFRRSIPDDDWCSWLVIYEWGISPSTNVADREVRWLPRSPSAISWMLDTDSWLYTVRMSHRSSRLSSQHIVIMFHTWSCNHRAPIGRDGRSPLTTWKMITPSRAFPYGRIPVSV